eukprot:gene32422-39207_t
MDFDELDLQEFDFSTDYGIDFLERSLSSSSPGHTTSDSDVTSEKDVALQSVRKRTRDTDDKKGIRKNGGVYFNYRKNGRLVPHVILPKILKNDIRRSYPAMFANVYNSCDESLMNKYLHTFYRPDFAMQHRFSPAKKAMGKKDEEVAGLKNIADFWWDKMNFSPDVHFALKEAQVTARSDGTGMVQFNYALSSTVLMPASGGDGNIPEPCNDVRLPVGYAGAVTPVHMVIEGSVTMLLDAENRIHLTYFDCV